MAKARQATHSGKSSPMDDIAGVIRKYFNMLPFERRQRLCEVITKPLGAIDAEIGAPDLDASFKDLLKAAVLVSAITSLMMLVGMIFVVLVSAIFTFGLSTILLAVPFVVFFLEIFVILAGWVLGSAVVFIVAKLLGGHAKFRDQLAVFGTIEASFLLLRVPLTLLGLIPCVGYFVNLLNVVLMLYMLYVQFKAAMALYGLSSGRAIIAVLAPIAATLLFILLMFALLFAVPFLLAGFLTFARVAGPMPVPAPPA